MATGRELLAIGPMNLDLGPVPGKHNWVVRELWDLGAGYERTPQWSVLGTNTVTSGHLVYGVYTWQGGQTQRIYYGSNDKLWEANGITGAFTDVTGTALTNNTNGVSFCSYGPYALAANGVDKIQIIRVPSTLGATDNFGDMQYSTGSAVISPKYIFSHKNHIVALSPKFLSDYGELGSTTTAVGGGYAAQPNNGSIQVLSNSAADGSAFTVTVYGTTTGTDDTTYEILTLNGLTAVTSSKVNWGKILAVKKSAATTGTITIRTTVGPTLITSMAPADLTNAVTTVPAEERGAGGQYLTIVASAATTKQVGFTGGVYNNSVYYDSQALTGITAVQNNVQYDTFVEIFTGDVENTITVTVSTHVYASGFEDPYLCWVSATDNQNGYGDPVYAPALIGSDRYPLLDGQGRITGGADGGDAFFVFKEGSIYRFDGPPFHPTVISHSVGMPVGNTPFRQGGRIYFYAKDGLSYVDINTNDVVNVMEGQVERSTIDFFNPNSGLTQVGFPDIDGVYKNNVNTNLTASIFGDGTYGLVWCIYQNGSVQGGAPSFEGGTGYIYHEASKGFTIVRGISTAIDGFVFGVAHPTSSSENNFPGRAIRAIGKVTATTHSIFSAEVVGLASGDLDSYIRWPFMTFPPEGGAGRITKVKPLFNTASRTLPTGVPIIKVGVTSVSRNLYGWSTDGVNKTNSVSYSKDGWYPIPGVPYADRHSIALEFTRTTSGGSKITIANLVGIIVEWETGPGRTQ